jgi:hypothetical protein
MRVTATLLTLTTLILIPAARSSAADAPSREARLLAVHHTRGAAIIASALSEAKPAARLRALRRAVNHLQMALRFAPRVEGGSAGPVRKAVAADLIRASNGLTRVNLDRKSLERAKKWNALSLRHDPWDADARNLHREIRVADGTDLFDTVRGRTAIERVRERRRTAGIPIRSRGLARRR